jgi:hypothetical protein
VSLSLECTLRACGHVRVGGWRGWEEQAVAMGFATFLVGFVLFFMVGVFQFPFGRLDATPPFSYEADMYSSPKP